MDESLCGRDVFKSKLTLCLKRTLFATYRKLPAGIAMKLKCEGPGEAATHGRIISALFSALEIINYVSFIKMYEALLHEDAARMLTSKLIHFVYKANNAILNCRVNSRVV